MLTQRLVVREGTSVGLANALAGQRREFLVFARSPASSDGMKAKR